MTNLILRSSLVLLSMTLLVIGGTATANSRLPAFPGAEGAGALALGGRGGQVCRVKNLNDSGPGSFRDCVDRAGPRTVIFDVGGTIKLKSRLTISNPYITIAGQTAPGGGIQIKADKEDTGWNPDFFIRTHDVVIRHLRFRRGYLGGDDKNDNISITDGARDVVLDHLSVFWGSNQNLGVRGWTSNPDDVPRNITVQNSIFTEMLDGRVAMLIDHNTHLIHATDIDFHNNLIANSSHRNPRLRTGRGRFINNIVYNWTSWATRAEGGVHWDFISNLWKPGPAPKGSRANPELMFSMREGTSGIQERDPELYVEGNRGILSGMSPDTNNWPYTREYGAGQNDPPKGPTPLAWRRYQPLPQVGIPITVKHVDDLEDYLLPIIGASKRLDCKGNWVPNRDAADRRAITEYLNNQGALTKSGQGEEIYGGHPVLASGVPCEDTSGDGIADEWAMANGLDAGDPSLGNTVHESGYTYLELYLNGMQVKASPPSRMSIIVE